MYHPEGDALYHSLQVFDLACEESPYDEDFLLAALLHDVGKAMKICCCWASATAMVERPECPPPRLKKRLRQFKRLPVSTTSISDFNQAGFCLARGSRDEVPEPSDISFLSVVQKFSIVLRSEIFARKLAVSDQFLSTRPSTI